MLGRRQRNAHRPPHPGEGPSVGTLSGLAVIGALVLLDLLVVDDRMVPLTSLAVAPLIAAMYAPPAHTAVVGALATATSMALGWADEFYDRGHIVLRVSLVAAVSCLAVLLAKRRRDREHRLSQVATVRELTTALQEALLPAPVLRSAGVSVSTRYVPGERRLLLGGDFFDVVELPSGRIAFVIGDVVGHGPVPAAMAASLRAGWRTLATTSAAPSSWLEGLDQAVLTGKPWPGFFVTCLAGTVDPSTSVAQVVSAGHPPPIVVRPGAAEVVEVEPGQPLGISSASRWPLHSFEVPSAALLLYTDGLIEGRTTRGADRFGEARLLAWLRRCHRPLDAAALDGLLREVQAANGGPLADDVAMVCLALEPMAPEPVPPAARLAREGCGSAEDGSLGPDRRQHR